MNYYTLANTSAYTPRRVKVGNIVTACIDKIDIEKRSAKFATKSSSLGHKNREGCTILFGWDPLFDFNALDKVCMNFVCL